MAQDSLVRVVHSRGKCDEKNYGGIPSFSSRKLFWCAGTKSPWRVRSGGCARSSPNPGGAGPPGHNAITGTGVPPRPAGQAQPGQQQQQQQEQLRIVADPATNSLVVYGTVQEYQNVKNILKEFDAIPRQVLIEAMILQIDLKDSEDFGVDYRAVSQVAADDLWPDFWLECCDHVLRRNFFPFHPFS